MLVLLAKLTVRGRVLVTLETSTCAALHNSFVVPGFRAGALSFVETLVVVQILFDRHQSILPTCSLGVVCDDCDNLEEGRLWKFWLSCVSGCEDGFALAHYGS